MWRGSFYVFSMLVGWAVFGLACAKADDVHLTGKSLTILEIVAFSQNPQAQVTLDEQALKNVAASFALIEAAALEGKPVYGLNVGVGWNKDRPVFTEIDGKRQFDAALLALSRHFNLSSLRAHAGGIGEPMAAEIVRAAMLIRLNQFLTGETGVHPTIVQAYADFLNQNIVPVVPSYGSVGAADITLASHIGLALVGEWFVFYQGEKMPADEALSRAGLIPVQPVGKDFLAILSTNALTVAQASLLVEKTRHYFNVEIAAFALALEAFNGNVAPFMEQVVDLRPYQEMQHAALLVRQALEKSYLWQQDENRRLQDPLSFRTMAYVLGDAWRALNELEQGISLHINASDDNPSAVVGGDSHKLVAPAGSQLDRYRIKSDVVGSVFPTAHFEMLPVAARVEALNVALARLSQSIVMQTIRFENPELTGLSRFLASDQNAGGHAFGAMQKPLVALYAQNRLLAAPVTLDTFAMAGNIEDIGSHAPLAVQNWQKILSNMYAMTSIQLLHVAQAIDLRGEVALGQQTRRLYQSYRAHVPFVADDRIYSGDFAKGIEILENYP